jgi:hypothetical protein
MSEQETVHLEKHENVTLHVESDEPIFDVPEWTSTEPSVIKVHQSPDGISALASTTGKHGESEVSVKSATSVRIVVGKPGPK